MPALQPWQKTSARPMGKAQFGSKKRPFADYGAYRNWWEGQNPDYFRGSGVLPWQRQTTLSAGAPQARPAAVPAGRLQASGGPLGSALVKGNPWDSYLSSIDRREQDLLERLLRSQQQSTRDYMGALAGFGGAISGTAADAWGRALGGYERAADATGAFQGAAQDDYSLGLAAANDQIARDFAAIGQAGPADIRDTAAAAQQVGTVGGENPAGVTGLVGKSWANYAQTVPGNLDFMTRQNIAQAGREGMKAEDEIRSEFLQMAQDNPQQAMEMWQAVQEYNWAKDDRTAKKAQAKIENAAAKAKDAREARAFELQVQSFNLKYGDAMADRASQLAKDTGTVWVYNPKTGRFDDTGRPTEARRKANQQAATTRRGQTLSAQAQRASRLSREEVARLSRELKLDLSKVTKDENDLALTPNRRSVLAQQAGEVARKAFFGTTYKDGSPKDKKREAQTVLMQLRGAGIPLSVALDAIAQYAWAKDSPWAYARAWRRKPGT